MPAQAGIQSPWFLSPGFPLTRECPTPKRAASTGDVLYVMDI